MHNNVRPAFDSGHASHIQDLITACWLFEGYNRPKINQIASVLLYSIPETTIAKRRVGMFVNKSTLSTHDSLKLPFTPTRKEEEEDDYYDPEYDYRTPRSVDIINTERDTERDTARDTLPVIDNNSNSKDNNDISIFETPRSVNSKISPKNKNKIRKANRLSIVNNDIVVNTADYVLPPEYHPKRRITSSEPKQNYKREKFSFIQQQPQPQVPQIVRPQSAMGSSAGRQSMITRRVTMNDKSKETLLNINPMKRPITAELGKYQMY